MNKRRQQVLCIGVGNEFRGDDALGLMVARQLATRQIPELVLDEQSGEGAALLQAWSGWDNVIIVDAISSGNAPGTIFRLDAHQQTIPTDFFVYSSHAFSVAEAIEMGRVLGQLPTRLIVYGVEGARFDHGTGVSSVVEAAIPELIARIEAEITGL
ncbi:MAG: hydrogenase maturation protease [Chloroflexi bacterium]|nr:hydrogenase maturation protease [Chloroflexota bacterium]